MLGFEASGGWRDVKGSVVMTVLQYLMGGGGSFSAGGPGTLLAQHAQILITWQAAGLYKHETVSWFNLPSMQESELLGRLIKPARHDMI